MVNYKGMFIFLLFLLVSAGSVSAECVNINNGYKLCHFDDGKTFNTTLPLIKVDFHETPVTIVEFSLRNIDDDVPASLKLLSAVDNVNFVFKPDTHLPNRKYEFYFLAEDTDGNVIETYLNFTIEVEQMDVWVITPSNKYVSKPKFAVGQSRNFSLELQLERDGTCGFRTTPFENRDFSDVYKNGLVDYFSVGSDSKKAIINNFNFSKYWPSRSNFNGEDVDGELAVMYLICQEKGGERYSYEEIHIGADFSAPIITLSASPSPVVDGNERSTNLSIETDDRSVCFVENNVFPTSTSNVVIKHLPGYPFNVTSDFVFERNEYLRFGNEQTKFEYSFNVTCENFAGRVSSSIIKIPVDLKTFQDVKIRSPDSLLNTKSVDLNVTTSLLSTEGCKYKLGNASTTTSMGASVGYLNGYGNIYSSALSLSEGENLISVLCSPSTVFVTKKVFVDTKSPSKPEIEADDNTCSLSRLKARITEGKDDEDGSGFDRYVYNLTLSNDSNNNYFKSGRTSSGRIDIRISGSRIKNETYTLTAYSVDDAGNEGPAVSKKIKVTDNKIGECDFVSPTIIVNSTRNNLTKFWDLTVDCKDTGTGCKSSYYYNILTNDSEQCSYTLSKSLGESFEIDKSAKMCAVVYDNNGNNKTYEENYTVLYPSFCDNKMKDPVESDVDCGGPCQSCPLNDTCRLNRDCESSYCLKRVCSVATCEDNTKNGLETDSDCGGLICNACSVNKTCKVDNDCSTLNCQNKKCLEASCTNDKIDGDETDLNCGGSVCDPCGKDLSCSYNSDCVSNYCSSSGKCELDHSLDTDGDDLPDYWEEQYCGCATCCDIDEDLDGDGFTNLEEFDAETDPTNPNDFPEIIEKNIVPGIMLILGIILIIVGTILLVLEKKKKENSSSEQKFTSEISHGPKPVVLKKEEERKLTPQEKIISDRLKKTSSIRKSRERKSLFDEFESGKKTIPKKIVPVIKKPEDNKPVVKEKVPVEEEHDVFKRLKKYVEKNKKK